jgi:error-prone DNA polymerase
MSYVELHARSAFSFLEGASLPETLIATAAERNLSAMALLDRHGVYGAPRFHMAAKMHKIKAHVGAEVEVTGAGSLPLLVASRTGYQNLCRLITTAKLRTDKKNVATVELEELESHAHGLICLTGDEKGPLAHALNNRDAVVQGRRMLQRLVSVFGRENVYVELQRHGDRCQESRNGVSPPQANCSRKILSVISAVRRRWPVCSRMFPRPSPIPANCLRVWNSL